VVVVEYGDYECPYCAAAAPVLRELVDESDGRVQLVYRNFPIADLRGYAESLGVDGALVVGEPAQAFADKVEQDFLAGVELGVPGTPTLVINGAMYQGQVGLTALRQATASSSPDGARRHPRSWWKRR
jgi:protein-disulfide isomerase